MPNNKSVYYEKLLEKWINRHKELQKEIFEKHKNAFEWFSNNSKQLAIGSLASIFLFTSPSIPQIPTFSSASSSDISQSIDKKVFLIYDLKQVLPSSVEPLTSDQEASISSILSRDFSIKVVSEIGGKRLNTTYGIIGQEQHLARYPGDNLYTHFDNQEDAQRYFSFGMAPGLGGFGYFADSKSAMTKEQSDREKYYIAVQTFLSPGYDSSAKDYVDFFKFRKMLVVNPQNGKAIIADIGDAGPAPFTGKQLGGSPEVMSYLERYDGSQRGPVLFFFIDDPSDQIPLGPISL